MQRLRAESKRPGTLKAARTPTLFGENRQPQVDYLGVPQTFSENRLYATAARLSADVIANMKLFTIPDPDGFVFGVISSAAFIAWQKAIGGRMKSDPSFSNTLVWNNFPFPAISANQRAAIIAGGQAVLDARATITNNAVATGRDEPQGAPLIRRDKPTLADLYQPLAMSPLLIAAHDQLDRAVDAVFGLKSPTDAQRLAALFKSYEQMTVAGQLPISKPKRSNKNRPS